MHLLTDYHYDLPEECIAHQPASRRDRSRLLWLDRFTGRIRHHRFDDLNRLLNPDDVLVVNDTAVIPARIMGRKETGGRVEVLLLDYPGQSSLENPGEVSFQCLIKASKRPAAGMRILFKNGAAGLVTGFKNGIFKLCIHTDDIDATLNKIGSVPLPPYIHRNNDNPPCDDLSAYQTVYAQNKGAVAAPTAGLHFTSRLIDRLKSAGIKFAPITLHVGYGTFAPVRVKDIRNHRIHTETYRIPEKTARIINNARAAGHRIIAVGTTSCRTLEYASDDTGRVAPGAGRCDLFIYPGYRFKAIDALITNFHLPQSTLLMLVSAFAGRERILATYREAIKTGYRFFSYGDAMFIG